MRSKSVSSKPAGRMDHIADPNPSPEELAEMREEAEATLRRLRVPGRYEPPTHLTVGLTPTWTAEIARYDGRGPCPVCGSNPPRGGAVCLVCSASARNPRRWPMQGEGPAPLGAKGKAGRATKNARSRVTLRGGLG